MVPSPCHDPGCSSWRFFLRRIPLQRRKQYSQSTVSVLFVDIRVVLMVHQRSGITQSNIFRQGRISMNPVPLLDYRHKRVSRARKSGFNVESVPVAFWTLINHLDFIIYFMDPKRYLLLVQCSVPHGF